MPVFGFSPAYRRRCCENMGLCIAACACSASVVVSVCWSWQLLIVLLISGLQFLADEDKLSLTLLPLFLLLSSPVDAILFFLSFFLPPLAVPFTPAASNLPFLSSARFAPSSTRLPSLVFLFYCDSVLRCHLLVLFSCLWHLHVVTPRCSSFFPSTYCFTAYAVVLTILSLLCLFPSSFLFITPLSCLVSAATSSHLFASLFHHLPLIFSHSVFHFCSSSSSLSSLLSVFLCLLSFFPCRVLMQNGMFYTSYVSTYLCLVRQVLTRCSETSALGF